MEGNKTYEEDFVDSRVTDVDFTLDRIREHHPEDSGWVMGEPEIESNGDGFFTIKVHLEKYDVPQKGRSM